jgi:hypothetical protein
MAPTCAHTGCSESLAEAGGRYCHEHGLVLALVLELAHQVPDKPPER